MSLVPLLQIHSTWRIRLVAVHEITRVGGDFSLLLARFIQIGVHDSAIEFNQVARELQVALTVAVNVDQAR